MITTIFFDVGGTLIHPDMSRLMAPLLARVKPGASHLLAAERAAKCPSQGIGNPLDGADATSGELGSHAGPVNHGYWQDFFAALLGAMGCGQELLPELTRRAGDSAYWSLVDPAAVSTLEQLRRQYRLAVISNADGHIDRVLQRGGLEGFFEALVDSGCVGFEKPDPRIFQSGLERLQARPEQSLYVGDIYAIDYQGACQAGMQAVLVDPNGVYRDWEVARVASLRELPTWVASRNE
jgi:HAD superfamily hydrolase (TIGR01509 family)